MNTILLSINHEHLVKISEAEALDALKELYECAEKKKDKDQNLNGNLRCAVSYLAYKDMKTKGKFREV
jgi:hypothetical protein